MSFRLTALFVVDGTEAQVRTFAEELRRVLAADYPDGDVKVDLRNPAGAAQVEMGVTDPAFHTNAWFAVESIVERVGSQARVSIDLGDPPSIAVEPA